MNTPHDDLTELHLELDAAALAAVLDAFDGVRETVHGIRVDRSGPLLHVSLWLRGLRPRVPSALWRMRGVHSVRPAAPAGAGPPAAGGHPLE